MESATATTPTGAYADSVDSSPRSRGTDSEPFSGRWDEPIPVSGGPSSKLRLMCSYGGRIVPRPHDKSLCYLGGDTRIVVVDRHSSLADLSSNLSRHLLSGRQFSLKYQLPTEDLDSLISVASDEDLENMVEEYDRCCSSTTSSKPSRLRLFLFPLKPDSVSSMSSLLEDSKTETWFVDALNGVGVVLPRDDSSVNSLLGLDCGPAEIGEEEQLPDSGKAAGGGKGSAGGGGSSGGQEVHSVPDSPMLDTASSFGSGSSAPCLSNLPPIRVQVESDLRGHDQHSKIDFEEHFAQLNVGYPTTNNNSKLIDEGFVIPSEKGFAEDERSEQSPAGIRKPLLKPSELRASKATTRSKPVFYQDPTAVPMRDRAAVTAATMSMAPGSNQYHGVILDSNRHVSDPNYRFHMPVQEPTSFVMPLQPDQQQYIHYLHHQAAAAAAPPPNPSYYQMHNLHHQQQQQQQQTQQPEPPYPMYFLHPQATAMAHLRHNQAYNLAMQTQNLGDHTVSSNNKLPTAEASPNPSSPPFPKLANPSAIPPPAYKEPSSVFSQHPSSIRPGVAPPRPELAGNQYRTAAAPTQQLPAASFAEQQQLSGYHQLHYPSHSAHFAYELSDPLQSQVSYHLPPSTNMNPHYQTVVNSAISEASLQLPSDSKQARNPQAL